MCLMYLQLFSVIAYRNIMVYGEQCHLSTMVYHDGIKDRRDRRSFITILSAIALYQQVAYCLR